MQKQCVVVDELTTNQRETQHLWAASDKLPRCEVLGTNLMFQKHADSDVQRFPALLTERKKNKGLLKQRPPPTQNYCKLSEKSKSVTSTRHQKCSSKRMNKPWPNACCMVLRQIIKLSQPFANWPCKKTSDWLLNTIESCRWVNDDSRGASFALATHPAPRISPKRKIFVATPWPTAPLNLSGNSATQRNLYPENATKSTRRPDQPAEEVPVVEILAFHKWKFKFPTLKRTSGNGCQGPRQRCPS